MSENLSQCKMVLSHFKNGGSLTSYEAYAKFGITQFAARIKDLEGQGHVINRVWETNAKNKRYKRYFLGVAA
ncbi:helix-turn-helix domain-containing protein [Neisseria sp. Dent CA1/247]|uniref:helix-turn-helix domain-containing protein n=1 Tax=Neisseria sp. Dent CA1/247 TaxID=2912675 RepID=UPI001FD4B6C2|nr:helix-turn-helix domain-containing protein [Neisseria sp. Dent CA1/247]UOO77950.1 helix-turn-helix domain-containing protein [Neisseria sp. Dent CA1/247]